MNNNLFLLEHETEFKAGAVVYTVEARQGESKERFRIRREGSTYAIEQKGLNPSAQKALIGVCREHHAKVYVQGDY